MRHAKTARITKTADDSKAGFPCKGNIWKGLFTMNEIQITQILLAAILFTKIQNFP